MMHILHDYTDAPDGGSRLCFTLAQALDVPLVLGFMRRGHPFRARYDTVRLRTLTPPVSGALLKPLVALTAFLAATAFVRHEDVALYSGTYAPLAVLRHPARCNVLYCHTPPRFLYDEHERFAAAFPQPVRTVFRLACQQLRAQYAAAVTRMDVVITNSATVRDRIAATFGRDALVIPPPCGQPTSALHPAAAQRPLYLSLSRLDQLKRVEVLIDAFKELPDNDLVITSSGPEAERLRHLAAGAPNISFTGTLDDSELGALLQSCTATLCVAKDEDFGMCAAESLAAGKPAIVAGAGGLAEIVQHEQTGLCLSAHPDAREVRQAVRLLPSSRAAAMREACLERAEAFSTQRFVDSMRRVLHGLGTDSTPEQAA